MIDLLKCEQKCGIPARVYAGDNCPDGWAGYYCLDCAKKLGFGVWSEFPNGVMETDLGKVAVI